MSNATFSCPHIDKLGFSGTKFFHNSADISIRHFNHQVLDRLAKHTVYVLSNNLWSRNLELVTLSTHSFNQDRQMELASTRYFECISRVSFFNTHSDVGFNLFEKSVTQVTRCHVLALSTCKRTVVYNKVHRNRRLINLDKRKRVNLINATNSFADI